MAGLHIIERKVAAGSRWHVYAWRGGPKIHTVDGARPIITRDLLDKALLAKRDTSPKDNIQHLIRSYTASEEFKHLSPETRRDYTYSLDKIELKFGQAPLPAFDDRRMRAKLIGFRDQYIDKPRTADKVIVMAGILLGWGMLRGFVSINVAHGIPLIYKTDRSELIWEQKHWDGFEDAPAQLMRALKLVSLTGLRLKDLVAVSWDHVEGKAIIMITSKRKKRVVIPIFDELRAWLDALPHQEGPLLLNSRGKGWTRSGLESVFQKNKPEGFDRTIHDIRGTFVTQLAVKGLTDNDIARIVGWSDRRISEIRARYVDEHQVVISLVDRLSA